MDTRNVASAAVVTIGPSPAPNRTDGGPEVESSITAKSQNILRSDTKQTPWSCIDEFDSVGSGLLLATSLFPPPSSVSDDRCCPLTVEERSELEYAINMAAVWRDRAEGGRLPHSVETSAALAAALLEDAIAHDYPLTGDDGGASRPSELSLRLSYSSAVVRATNGLADASIANRASKSPRYGISVAALCERLGIPGWIVDMRHDAAHNELPSLPSLRLAAKTLLAFLGDRYWAEMSRLRGDVMTKALDILDTYKASAKAVAVEESARVASQIAKAEIRKAARKEQRDKKKKQDEKQTSDNDGEESSDGELFGFGQYSIFADIKKRTSKKRPREEPAAAEGAEGAPAAPAAAQPSKGAEGASAALAAAPAAAQSSSSSPPPPPPAGNNASKPDTEPTLTQDEVTNGIESNSTSTDIKETPEKETKTKLPSPLDVANKYIDEIPIDIGLQILLSYLVWGGVGELPPEKGALVPGSPATIPETDQGFDKVKNRYSLLLTVVASAYTGFLQALIVNLADIVILFEERIPEGDGVQMDPGDERKVFFLSSWIKYLLSREFQSHFDPHIGTYPKGNIDLARKKYWKWTKSEKAYMADCAPLEVLRRWHFPLNSLFDRCNESLAARSNRKVAELAAVFKEAAGESFVQGMGLGDAMQRKADGNEMADVALCKDDKTKSLHKAVETSSSLTLEQVEALLSDSDPDDGKDVDAKPTKDAEGSHPNEVAVTNAADSGAAWIMCKSWDPCAIGTLPGHPSY